MVPKLLKFSEGKRSPIALSVGSSFDRSTYGHHNYIVRIFHDIRDVLFVLYRGFAIVSHCLKKQVGRIHKKYSFETHNYSELPTDFMYLSIINSGRNRVVKNNKSSTSSVSSL